MDPSEPLATLDPADRPQAKADTTAPEAAAWLANPEAVAQARSANLDLFLRWENEPEWTGPTISEQHADDAETNA